MIPTTKSSILGMYIPVNGITFTLSLKTLDNPIVVDIIFFPSNTTFRSSLSGAVVRTSPGRTNRFFNPKFFNYFSSNIF